MRSSTYHGNFTFSFIFDAYNQHQLASYMLKSLHQLLLIITPVASTALTI